MTDPCRIVICDDQPEFRRLLSVVLGLEEGLEVIGEAADGRAAIEVVAALTPDVILLDIAMPEMDGIEALPHIRRESPATSVVMVTAFASTTVRERALAAGAHAFVEKGSDLSELVAEIRSACA